MAQWLKACGVETVAMQVTGVYRIALFQKLRISSERGERAAYEDVARA
jgi:hypothetical protein